MIEQIVNRRVISRVERSAILKVWHHKCAYCKKVSDKFHIDHVVPFSKGGSCDLLNLVPACKDCNSTKFNLTLPKEYMGILLAKAASRKERITFIVSATKARKERLKKRKVKKSYVETQDKNTDWLEKQPKLFSEEWYSAWDYCGPAELYSPTKEQIDYLELINLNVYEETLVYEHRLLDGITVKRAKLRLSDVHVEDYGFKRLSLQKKISIGWGLECAKIICSWEKDETTLTINLDKDFSYVYQVFKSNYYKRITE